jgi:transcriptional regulator with XRE-family HTH domain
MKKIQATMLLGGTQRAAADAMGITCQAYSQWPEDLPRRLQDRVQAAIARKHLSPEVLGEQSPLPDLSPNTIEPTPQEHPT